MKHPKINWRQSLLFLAGAEITVALYYAFRWFANVYQYSHGPKGLFAMGFSLLLMTIGFICFAIAVFQWKYLKVFVKEFKRQLIYAGVIAIILYNVLMYFQGKWHFFSELVSIALYFLLSPFYEVQYGMDAGGPIMAIGDFAVNIGPPCSGIESMLLFTCFFAALYALDYKKIRTLRYFSFFIAGFIGVIAVNILRLYLLLLVGIHLSPEFAVGLFHTNAGWIFFIIYFLFYYWLIKRWIYKES